MVPGLPVIGNPYIIIQPAGIAQLVEQLLRKQLVGGSSPLSGTKYPPVKKLGSTHLTGDGHS